MRGVTEAGSAWIPWYEVLFGNGVFYVRMAVTCVTEAGYLKGLTGLLRFLQRLHFVPIATPDTIPSF
jgi:hypothetical protein